jgi:hypothetical protein
MVRMQPHLSGGGGQRAHLAPDAEAAPCNSLALQREGLGPLNRRVEQQRPLDRLACTGAAGWRGL